MFTELICLGKYVYLITDYAYDNKKLIGYACGIYDASKFAYNVSNKFGMFNYKPLEKITFIELIGVERTPLGEFEILE